MAYTNIDDPSAYFQTLLWTGNTSAPRSFTNDGNSNLQPDMVWAKNRTSNGTDHELYDSSRGTGTERNLQSNSTAAEGIGTTYGQLTSFDTDGFTVNAGGTNDDKFNENGSAFVAWQWKCNGGTTASNTDGDINSTVQVNQDAGFSIVTYTGNGSTSDQTIGHGLGVRANAVIVKNRDAAVNWVVWSEGVDANHSLELNTLDTISDSTQGRVLSNAGSRGTSTIFSIRSGSGSVVQTNTNGEDYVAYCFAEKQGYSKFGSYVANYLTNGPFVYTGFKPAWVMIKNTAQSTNWEMYDVKRNPGNVANLKLGANRNAAENGSDLGNTSQNNIDILSNGFKIVTRNTDTNYNAGDKLIYMAFAENPFVSSTGIPTTAR
jgi:hypothetical protein